MKLTHVDEEGRALASKEFPDPVETVIPLMSLRDYFAAAALTGALANSNIMQGILSEAKSDDLEDEILLAGHAFEIANAMLEARHG